MRREAPQQQQRRRQQQQQRHHHHHRHRRNNKSVSFSRYLQTTLAPRTGFGDRLHHFYVTLISRSTTTAEPKMNEIWKKFGIVFSKGPSTMFGLELILLSLLFTSRSSDALSFIPEVLWYKTCADSPPGFSPGCMNNVTVNVGDRAVFNCQVWPFARLKNL